MNTSNFIGYFELSKNTIICDRKFAIQNSNLEINDVSIINNILDMHEINFLLEEVRKNNSIPVGIDGIAKNYNETSKVHSYRSTIYDESFAKIIFSRINNYLKPLENNYESGEILVPYAVNPAFRFIKYAEDGYLVPHYDFPFKKENNNLSLMSLVIYLTDSEDGKTQFIQEYRDNDETDWIRQANDKEVILSVKPTQGSALLFPHKILHQSEISRSEKIIIRTDIMYKKVI